MQKIILMDTIKTDTYCFESLSTHLSAMCSFTRISEKEVFGGMAFSFIREWGDIQY